MKNYQFDPHSVMRSIAYGALYTPVTSQMTLGERFSAIKANYAIYQREVDEGISSWMDCDPYRIADWITLFTPIEASVWSDIRYYSIPMWPQFPVGRYFADFGNPVAKIALECDGKAFHDPVKDAARDRDFRKMGWRVIRAPGSQCVRTMDSELEMRERDEEIPEGYAEYRDQMTLDGVMKSLRDELRALRAEETTHDRP